MTLATVDQAVCQVWAELWSQKKQNLTSMVHLSSWFCQQIRLEHRSLHQRQHQTFNSEFTETARTEGVNGFIKRLYAVVM